jgi:hypothetical protein
MALPDDPDLARLGRDFDDELRAEAAEYEALAAKDLLRRRSLSDVALDLVHRGDRVLVEVGAHRFTGTVVDATGDLAVVRTATGDVDVRLTAPLAIRVVEPVRAGGRPRGRGARTFKARLTEHEAAGAEMELGCPPLDLVLRGRVEAVATDHLVIADADGQRIHLALTAVAWARPLPG